MKQTFHSFKDAFASMGYKAKEQKKTEKEFKCRVCGSPMIHIPGTNVIKCTGTSTDEEGKEKQCKNFILLNSK